MRVGVDRELVRRSFGTCGKQRIHRALLGNGEADVAAAIAARETSGSHAITSFGQPGARQEGP